MCPILIFGCLGNYRWICHRCCAMCQFFSGCSRTGPRICVWGWSRYRSHFFPRSKCTLRNKPLLRISRSGNSHSEVVAWVRNWMICFCNDWCNFCILIMLEFENAHFTIPILMPYEITIYFHLFDFASICGNLSFFMRLGKPRKI